MRKALPPSPVGGGDGDVALDLGLAADSLVFGDGVAFSKEGFEFRFGR